MSSGAKGALRDSKKAGFSGIRGKYSKHIEQRGSCHRGKVIFRKIDKKRGGK